MRLQPTSLDALQALVPAHPRIRVRGGGTKTGLSGDVAGCEALDLSALDGITEYTPAECVFTAWAGTRIADIERVLAEHGQYLPFDPPLAAAGATLGGTVAAGVNGSCRLRYGGVRDFVIGARIVDGRGRLTRSGGKVVKNAAGFLLHQALAGSCGRLGVLAEITCKVFPAPDARVTVRADAGDLAAATAAIERLQRARCDLEAIDIEPPGILWLRLGGFEEALGQRVQALRTALGVPGEVLTDSADLAVWRHGREYEWVPENRALVRVPITLPVLPRLDTSLEWYDAIRRYGIAGNVALVAWNGALDALSDLLRDMALTGQVLIGPPGRAFIGAVAPNPFEQRLHAVMDPDGRFAP